MFDCQSLFTSVPGARIGRRIKGGMPLLQILGSEVDWRHIRHCKDTERYAISGKRGRRKTAKKKKKKKDCGCRRKLCPQGVIFDGQTAQPPDLDGPSETGYLCGLFVFLNGDYKV